MENTKPKRTRRRASGHGFGVIDWAILLVVGLATFITIFGWVHASPGTKEQQTRNDTCVVTFLIDETHYEVMDGLEFGDRLYLFADGSFIGYLRDDLTMTEVSDTPDFLRRVTGTGSMVCVGQEDGGSVLVGDHAVTPGDVLEVRTERELLTIHIMAVTKS